MDCKNRFQQVLIDVFNDLEQLFVNIFMLIILNYVTRFLTSSDCFLLLAGPSIRQR